MRKYTTLLVTISLTLGVVSATSSSGAQTPPKVGSVCAKVGAFFDTPNTRYVCNQEGKKKVWRVWTPPKKSGATSAPTTSGTSSSASSGSNKSPAPFKAPIPITLPIAQNGTITFTNIVDRISDISKTAWQSVQDVIAKNPVSAPITNAVHVGPNTQIDVVGGLPRIQSILDRSQRLWSGFTQVSTFNLLMYNAQDEPWAEQDWRKTGKEKKFFNNVIEEEVLRIAGNCQASTAPGVFSGPPVNCRGANSTAITNTDEASFTFGQGGKGAANDPYVTGGGIVGHEYIHAIQAAQWIGKPSSYCTEQNQTQSCFRSWSSNWGFSPCWLFEGLPNSVGPMTSSETYAAYQEYRKNVPYGQGPTTVTDYSEASLRDYLVNQSSSTCYSNGGLYRLGYTTGALTVEALVAIAGPQSVMALFAKGAEGEEFTTAFQSVYGIKWSDAASILAKVLAAEYATAGPAPR